MNETHSIPRWVYEVRGTTKDSAQSLENWIRGPCHQEFLEEMQSLLDEYEKTPTFAVIDKLTIDLGQIEDTSNSFEVRSRFREIVEGELRRIISTNGLESPSGQLESKNDSIQEALKIYLNLGVFPWWFNGLSSDEVLPSIIENTKKSEVFSKWFYKVLIDQPHILKRILFHFSDSELAKLFHSAFIDSQSRNSISPFIEVVARHAHLERNTTRELFWNAVVTETHDVQPIDTKKGLSIFLSSLLTSISRDKRTFMDKITSALTNASSTRLTIFFLEAIANFRHNTEQETPNSLKQVKDPSDKGESKKGGDLEPTSRDNPSKTSRQKNKPPRVHPDISERQHQRHHEPGNTEAKPPISPASTPSDSDSNQATKQQGDQNGQHSDNTPSEAPESNDGQLVKIPAESLFIKNAGLAILAPYIPAYLEQLGLCKDGVFHDEGAQIASIHSLQYLVTLDFKVTEADLLLNKILCDYPWNQPLPLDINLPKELENAAQDLVKSVINNWKSLKNTSVEGFREAFLCRSGKLSESDNAWILHVEQKTYDVILDTIPWGFNLVRYSWMREPLIVEWKH